jgi:hypothetical protein
MLSGVHLFAVTAEEIEHITTKALKEPGKDLKDQGLLIESL